MTDIGMIVAVVSSAISVASFYVGRATANRAEGKEAGSLATDLKYIKESVERIETRLNDDVKRLEGRIDELSNQLVTISGTAAKGYESAKMEHNRLNEHLERDHGQTVVRTRISSND
ncbi:hypothetical protein [Tepidibacillus marianensis]|uniref:hypothetical protein n=1 Tax=Tepidibacillus marianensis TaxID=3131995 RepID=UPI0030CF61BD